MLEIQFSSQDGNALYGDYWAHLQDAVSHRDHPNVLLLWYEDMKKDLGAVVKKCQVREI